MAVKFNDYFEFPREFDMAPYTASTLAKLEGTVRTCMSICIKNKQEGEPVRAQEVEVWPKKSLACT